MTNYTFNINWPEDSDEQKRLYALLDTLATCFGLNYRAVAFVQTDKDFLVPMLEELEDQSLAKVAVPVKVAESKPDAPGEKICLECGEPYSEVGIKGFCSKKCYNIDYRKTHKAEKKPSKKGYKTSVENQDAAAHNRTAEEERIEAVVAKAKDTAPGASFEHTVMHAGPIMARKL